MSAVVYKAQIRTISCLPPQKSGASHRAPVVGVKPRARGGRVPWERTGDSVPQLGCRFDVAHHRSCFGAPRHGPEAPAKGTSKRHQPEAPELGSLSGLGPMSSGAHECKEDRRWAAPAANRNTPSFSLGSSYSIEVRGALRSGPSVDGCVRKRGCCLCAQCCWLPHRMSGHTT